MRNLLTSTIAISFAASAPAAAQDIEFETLIPGVLDQKQQRQLWHCAKQVVSESDIEGKTSVREIYQDGQLEFIKLSDQDDPNIATVGSRAVYDPKMNELLLMSFSIQENYKIAGQEPALRVTRFAFTRSANIMGAQNVSPNADPNAARTVTGISLIDGIKYLACVEKIPEATP